MASPPAEAVLLLEPRYVCSECSQLSPSLEAALLHHQSHLTAGGGAAAAPQTRLELLGLPGGDLLAVPESSHYQCLECGQLLLSPGQLLEHQELHLEPSAKSQQQQAAPGAAKPHLVPNQIHYECVECGALFGGQDAWLAHRQSHRHGHGSAGTAAAVVPNARVDVEHSYRKPEDEEEELAAGVQLLLYECAQCLQLFHSPKDVLEHQAGCRLPPSDHSYEVKADGDGEERNRRRAPTEQRCSECQQLFASPRRLQRHLRCHRLGAFQCPLCSKVLPTPAALEQHVAGHSAESHFLCLDCGLAFDTEAVLLAHRRTHGAEALHRCGCGKAFVNMTKFLYHRRTHGALGGAAGNGGKAGPEDLVLSDGGGGGGGDGSVGEAVVA
ncbi:zinc finger protein 574-like, partial [Lagopus leucura]|uniref:zinc finger protein 574-like n=1 Tax=Lagopus leucura TaxID=30410 RepID=UPI001C672281